MKYIVLFRGINVGGNRKVEMKRLKTVCISMGYTEVSTYINSGNLILESSKSASDIHTGIVKRLSSEFGFTIDIIVKTAGEMKRIADAIPPSWQNDDTHKTDVAYLFPEMDKDEVVETLPISRDLVDVRYVSGALIWRVSRADYNKSRLNKLISHKIYKQMTVRNVNTARYLGNL